MSGDWHPRLPDRIPGPPDLSVDYFDVEDPEPVGGEGSMVSVGTVADGDRTHRVALERPSFPGPLHTGLRERFRAAAGAWADLSHPSVLGVLGHGVEPRPWVAVEYADGGALPDRDLPLSLPELLWVCRSLAAATAHAHDRGTLHRAIRPASVLFRSTDGDWPAPKVGGWELARAVAEQGHGIRRLAPAYAAPEQIDRERGRPDERTDVYRLGAVAYLLATGDPPFPGVGPRLEQAVLDGDPTPPSEGGPVPAEFDEVVLQALATDPDDRYGSAAALEDALGELVDAYADGRIEATPAAGAGGDAPSGGGDGDGSRWGGGIDVGRRTALAAGAGVVGLATLGAGASALLSGGSGSDPGDGSGSDSGDDPGSGTVDGTADGGDDGVSRDSPGSGGRSAGDVLVQRDGPGPDATLAGVPTCESAADPEFRVSSVSLSGDPGARWFLSGRVEYVGEPEDDGAVTTTLFVRFFDGDGQSLGSGVKSVYFDPAGSDEFRIRIDEDIEATEIERIELTVDPSGCLA